jgi:hypothetical protein
MAQRLGRLFIAGLLGTVGLIIWWTTSAVRPAQAQSVDWPGFAFYHEFFGPQGYADPGVAQNLIQGMMTGLTFTPPVDLGVVQTTRPYNAGLMLRLAGAAQPAGISDDAINLQRTDLMALAESTPAATILWDLLPEWDQSGGAWVPNGRPAYQGLTRAQAHAAFLRYYRSAYPKLSGYLSEPLSGRKYLLASVTDYAPNVFDTYELGVDLQLLERGIDELGDLSTGVAFLRGAANQYGRAWGVDLSTWRTSTGKATTYSASGTLLGGWSESYMRRLYYMAFLSGAQVIQNEAANYRYANGRRNPFGDVTQEFADFALRQHPELGHPSVSTALLVNPDAGFDPKHSIFNQADAVWYQDLPYTAGDSMMNQFFRLAYPGHWLHGLAPGAPFADPAGVPDTVKFQNYLASGLDPRPYEPQPTTRWGDQLDVITTRVADASLQRYKVIILLGDVTLDSRLRTSLKTWVSNGGVLLMNAAQASADDQALLGVKFDSASPRTSSSFRWTSLANSQKDFPYKYSVVHADTAEVWAVSDAGDPVITSNPVGAGQVLFTTPAYLLPSSRDNILVSGLQLLDWLIPQFSSAQVSGGPAGYVVNEVPGKIVVGVFNPSGSPWTGTVTTRLPDGLNQVMEYTSAQAVPFQTSGQTVNIQAQVPAFDLRVFAVEYSGSSSAALPKPALRHAARPFRRN